MKIKSISKWIIFFSIFITLLVTLACGLDLGGADDAEKIGLQQTAVSLQLTQSSLENQQPDIPIEIPDEIITPTSTSTLVPPSTPTNTSEPPDVSYEGISFFFEKAIAQDVIPSTIQGQNRGEESMPGDTYPTHYVFTFSSYAVSDHFHEPIIRVYPAEEYRIISPYALQIIDSLGQTLIDQPTDGQFSNLPFLPIWNAAQIFSAKVEYFDFQNGSGIRYLTMYGQAIYPVDNTNLFYTYQGLTSDGRYYISAILPVINGGLPNDGSSQIGDYMEFEENWDNYISQTITWLNEQSPQNFLPSLESLDAMMSSFMINR